MRKTISLRGRFIEYELRKSRRAKRARISISCSGAVAVTLPWFLPAYFGETFLRERSEWIIGKLTERKEKKQFPVVGSGKREYDRHRAAALAFVRERTEYWNRYYGFSYGSVSVRNQKTRWGSCSKQGNLSFNWKLLFLPQALSDYVIIHELCHLQEFNHSKAFWKLVGQSVPDHERIRKELKAL